MLILPWQDVLAVVKLKKLSFYKNESTRLTFCINCNKSVTWEEIKENI